MAIQVKVCGLTRREDIELALSLGADYLGIILHQKSPRAVDLEKVPELLAAIPAGKRVVVDVAPQPGRVEQYKDLGFDYFQFHFDLEISMATVAVWSELVGHDRLWLAPRLPADEPNFPQILMEFADTFLLDAFDRHAYGGTGIAGENWQRFLDCTVLYQHKRWVLAGGLSPDNIADALAFTQAGAIDVNSGVESAPGVKDPDKLRALFERVRDL